MLNKIVKFCDSPLVGEGEVSGVSNLRFFFFFFFDVQLYLFIFFSIFFNNLFFFKFVVNFVIH